MIHIPSYLTRSRHGLYYLRLRVPRNFQEQYGKEIRRSLRTGNLTEATCLARPLLLRYDAIFKIHTEKTDMLDDLLKKLKAPMVQGAIGIEKKPDDEIATLLKILIEKTEGAKHPHETSITAKKNISLADAIEEFLTEKLRINPNTEKGQKGWDTEKARTERPPLVKILLDLIGNVSMSSIDRSTVETASQNLSMLPPNRKKSKEFRDILDLLTRQSNS